MKKSLFLILLALACTATLQAQKKAFVRDYTYQASEVDSKVTARTFATEQMRNILLSELGQYLHVERTLEQDDTSEAFSQKIEAITAGIVEMKTLDEQWDGATYYIKAEMTVDPKDLERRIAEVINDKQKTQELEESRKRTLAAETEVARLRKELEESKNEQQRLVLQAKYQQTADALSAEEYYTKGFNARENGFNALAIEYYQKTIALNPNNAKAYNNMGNAYNDLKKHGEAIRCFQEAIAIDPNLATVYVNMGNAYDGLKNYQETFRYYQKALTIDPNFASAYYNMGVAYMNLENYGEAIRCYKKTVAIDPNMADAYGNMGLSYANLKNYGEAIQCYKKAVAIDPNDAETYGNMGVAYGNLKNYNEAIRHFKKAVTIDPNDTWTYNNMGVAYEHLEDYGEAIQCYQKAVAIDPDCAVAHNNMGNAYVNLDNYDEATRCYQKAARLGYSDAQALLRKNGHKW
jgi:superkiller protein 3